MRYSNLHKNRSQIKLILPFKMPNFKRSINSIRIEYGTGHRLFTNRWLRLVSHGSPVPRTGPTNSSQRLHDFRDRLFKFLQYIKNSLSHLHLTSKQPSFFFLICILPRLSFSLLPVQVP